MIKSPTALSNQRLEIFAAWSLTALCVVGLVWLALSFITGGEEEKGTLIGTVATGLIALAQIGFNRIGQIGQSRAMQKMADALHASAPVPGVEPSAPTEADFNYQTFPKDKE
jgi:hypothetical protein